MPTFGDIFEWKSWDDMGSKVFYNCTLLRAVGKYPTGSYFECITWDDETFIMTFCENAEDADPVMMKKMRLVEID